MVDAIVGAIDQLSKRVFVGLLQRKGRSVVRWLLFLLALVPNLLDLRFIVHQLGINAQQITELLNDLVEVDEVEDLWLDLCDWLNARGHLVDCLQFLHLL
jgi:hypothetical protein